MSILDNPPNRRLSTYEKAGKNTATPYKSC